MSYLRVIPRDLFNEANLLKCYGQLYLLTEGNPLVRFGVDEVESFEICQSPNDGSLTIENLPFFIGAREYRLTIPLNSREPWPLYIECCSDDDDLEPTAVFTTTTGKLSVEMKALCRLLQR